MMEPREDKISTCLEETFYILSKKNAVYRVKLSEKGLCMQKEYNGNVKTETISLNDIIGCRCMRYKRTDQKCSWHPVSGKKHSKNNDADQGTCNSAQNDDDGDISAYLYIYAYVLKKGKVKGKRRRERMIVTLRFRSFDTFDENIKEAQKWRATIRYLMETQMTSHHPSCYFTSFDSKIENKILFVINPKSGVGKAREVFQNKVVPVLNEADVKFDVHVTRYPQDARSTVRTQNLWQYMGGIVVVGGDGILFEVINGLMERPDWQMFLSQLKFGIIPSGSGNGLAKSISYAFNEPHDKSPVLVSALSVARGFSSPLDLVRVELTNSVLFSFLSIGWGFLSDIDIESERLRSLGSQRFTLWSVARLIGLRTYKATLSYLPVVDEEPLSPHDSHHEDEDSEGDCGGIRRRESFYSAGSRRSAYHSVTAASSSYESLTEQSLKTFGPASSLPPLSQPITDPAWVTTQGEFVMIHGSVVSHLARDVLFAPSARLDDGCIWLCVIRAGISRSHLLQFLLGLSSGSHVSVPDVEMLRVLGFRLVPETCDGHLTVDGELVECGPLQAEILPQAIRVFSRTH